MLQVQCSYVGSGDDKWLCKATKRTSLLRAETLLTHFWERALPFTGKGSAFVLQAELLLRR